MIPILPSHIKSLAGQGSNSRIPNNNRYSCIIYSKQYWIITRDFLLGHMSPPDTFSAIGSTAIQGRECLAVEGNCQRTWAWQSMIGETPGPLKGDTYHTNQS